MALQKSKFAVVPSGVHASSVDQIKSAIQMFKSGVIFF